MTKRVAFTMTLKPGALAEYTKRHDEIWPELVTEIERSGITGFTTFVHGSELFLYSEIEDDDAWDRLWHSDIHQKWSEVMEPLMNIDSEGIVESSLLTEIFHIETKTRG
jgi:L-rhamnose mutarotase